jgi:hypothetical protein
MRLFVAQVSSASLGARLSQAKEVETMLSDDRSSGRCWSVVTPMPAPELTGMAQMMEAAGVHRLFAPQGYCPPWIPVAIAAGTRTSKTRDRP